MKIFLIIFLVVDILLVAAAGVRFTSATPETAPFVDLMGGFEDSDSTLTSDGSVSADDVVHRAGANEADAFMNAKDPNQGKDMAVESQLGTASQIEDNRVNDLDAAKQEIGKIGK